MPFRAPLSTYRKYSETPGEPAFQPIYQGL
nr:MAG TPA: hypothetical protein [Caudoviricetes sp.]